MRHSVKKAKLNEKERTKIREAKLAANQGKGEPSYAILKFILTTYQTYFDYYSAGSSQTISLLALLKMFRVFGVSHSSKNPERPYFRCQDTSAEEKR